jgi:hypothetical protein
MDATGKFVATHQGTNDDLGISVAVDYSIVVLVCAEVYDQCTFAVWDPRGRLWDQQWNDQSKKVPLQNPKTWMLLLQQL